MPGDRGKSVGRDRIPTAALHGATLARDTPGIDRDSRASAAAGARETVDGCHAAGERPIGTPVPFVGRRNLIAERRNCNAAQLWSGFLRVYLRLTTGNFSWQQEDRKSTRLNSSHV